ncbi:MAG: hypothetical protein IK020_00215 [Clostridiales bacterium]|nr:hypothetical protein [Clostridiales bacterium]
MITRQKNSIIRLLSLILTCALITSSCKGTGESSSKKKSTKKNANDVETEDTTLPYVDEMEDYWNLEDSSDSEALGNSPALSFSPCDGIHVNAKENQLYSDTEITFTPMEDESDPKVQDALAILEENEILAFGIWDVDAGLDPQEVLPGQYNVSIDLEYLELDSELYDYTRIYRIDDEGNFFILNSEVDGSIIHYSTCQNSLIIVGSVGLGLIAGFYIADQLRNGYYYDSKSERYIAERSTDYGSFLVKWLMEDALPELHEKVVSATNLQQKHQQEAKEYTKQFSSLPKTKQNAIEAARYKDLLEEDSEYQTLRKEIAETKWPFPEIVTFAIEAITDAYNYLGGAGYKMPKYTVEFQLKKGLDNGGLGMAQSPWYARTYLELDINELQTGEKKKKDNFRITVTHELFHLCQNRYRTYFVDSVRFDEMVAIILEEDALAYYKSNGKIDTDVELTDTYAYGIFRIPPDGDPDSSSVKKKAEDMIIIQHGYNWGGFVSYLRKNVKSDVTAKTIMDARGYFTTPEIVSTITNVFGISKSDLCKHFHDYMVSRKSDVGLLIFEINGNSPYRLPAAKYINEYMSEHLDLICDGSLTMTMRPIVQNWYAYYQTPYLIVPDEGTTLDRGNVDIVPCSDYVETPKGLYIPMVTFKKDTDAQNEKYMCIMEIYGDVSDTTNLQKGYTVHALGKIGEPSFEYVKDTNQVKVIFPEKSESCKSGVIDGYVLTVKSSLGEQIEVYYPVANLDNEQFIDVSQLRPNEKISEDVTLTATLCEYVKGSKDEILLAIPSDEYSYEIKGEFYDSAIFTYNYGSESSTYHISGGRFAGLKFTGDSYDGTNGYVWCLSQIKRGDTISITASTNSTCTYNLSVYGYNRDVSSGSQLISEDGMASFTLDSFPDDVYFIEVTWWNRDENRGVQLSFEVVDEYTIPGIPELTITH